MNKLENEIAEALEHLDPASLNYSEWLSVGMALKNEGLMPEMWESWSVKDGKRYHPGECLKKWNTFERSGTGKGTIFLLCKQYSGHVVQGSDYKYYGEIAETSTPDPGLIRWTEPGQDWNPLEDIQKYISVLFNPAEYVGYCVNSKQDQRTGKYIPCNRGNYDRTAERLLQELSSAKRIEDVFMSYNPKAGAWIRFNPLDGAGAKDVNVTDYRFTLIESDNMPVTDQIQKYLDLKLPIAALVYSGGKSAHAIVKINAKTKEEYDSRINLLYSELEKIGFETDTQNRNPSRLSRAPGFMRNGKKQYLIAVNIGMSSWESWAAGREEAKYKPKLPEPISANMIHDPPPRPVPLIHDTLNPGEVMLLSGPPKAGKSFLTMQLALAVATGSEFITLKCKKSRVLYVDGEVGIEALIERVRLVMEKMGLQRYPDEMMNLVSVRDKDLSLDDVITDIEHMQNKPDLVILDPYYIFSVVNENDNSELRGELKQLYRLKKMNVAVIVIHHQTKGSQAGKSNIDRAAGGSTFARFADTVSSLNLLEQRQGDDFIPERFESDNRNFPPKSQSSKIDLMFNGYHFPDRTGLLSDRGMYEPGKAFIEKRKEDQNTRTNTIYLQMKTAGALAEDGTFTLKDFKSFYEKKYGYRERTTLRGDLERSFNSDSPTPGKEKHYWKDEDYHPENKQQDPDMSPDPVDPVDPVNPVESTKKARKSRKKKTEN